MFCRTKTSGNHTYLQIVENRREGGKVRQHVIANLGRLDKLLATGALDRFIASAVRFSERLMVLAERDRMEKEGEQDEGFDKFVIGSSMVFERLWQRTGCADIVRKMLVGRRFGFDVERAVFMSVLHRVVETGSDRGAMAWKDNHAIEGVEGLELHHLYRAMAWLGEELEGEKRSVVCVKDVMEEELFARRADLFSGLDLVFFDTTSLYFTGQGGTVGQRGISKDHRPHCKQVVLGVVVDAEGTPVCSHMWPGNTTDVTTLKAVAHRLRNRFGIRRVCLVADRGMISEANIKAVAKMGWEYIVGARPRNSNEIRDRVLTDEGAFETEEIERQGAGESLELEVKEVVVKDLPEDKVKKSYKPRPPRRYIVCRSSAQARRDEIVRHKIIEDLEEKLVSKPKSLVGNKGYRRFLKTRAGGMEINYDKMVAEQCFDGIWVLRTNSSMPAGQVARCYKQLWQVESLFRCAKSILNTRPVYHQTDAAIRGHVFCSFLALFLRKELLRSMEEKNIKAEWNDIVRDLNSLTDTEVCADGKRFLLRSTAKGATGAIFRCLGLRLPGVIRRIKDDDDRDGAQDKAAVS